MHSVDQKPENLDAPARPKRCQDCGVRHVSLCGALDCMELAEMDRIAIHTRSIDGSTIVYEGDESAQVYNLTEGTVRLTRLLPDGRRSITGFLFPGDFLGLSCGGKYVYSAEAINPVSACQFRKRDLDTLFERFPKLEGRLLNMVTTELAAAQDQMLLLSRKTPKEKIASFLLWLGTKLDRLDPAMSQKDQLDLPMTRTDIADYLGLTIETVSRTLASLVRDGIIALPSRRQIHILDNEQLIEIAEG